LRTGFEIPKLDPAEPEVIGKYELKLATPMIGGGAVAGRPDPHWPIRSASIRGHLRFWWRATKQFSAYKDLFESEALVWGSSEGHGLVGIRVDESVASERQPLRDRDDVPPYVRNLLTQGGNPVYVTKDASFSLTLVRNRRSEELDLNHLRLALSCWTSFGGLGARTRRGCGALSVKPGEVPTPKFLLDELLPKLTFRVDGQCASLAPFDKGRYCLGPPKQTRLEAWQCAVSILQQFRIANRDHGLRIKGNDRFPSRIITTGIPYGGQFRPLLLALHHDAHGQGGEKPAFVDDLLDFARRTPPQDWVTGRRGR
jgi:CRISPR type III-B/RAMP module RAMP protein Cmr1